MSSNFLRQIGSNGPSELIIAIFNVHSVTSSNKRKLLAKDLAARKVALCCLQETKCANGLHESCRGYTLICLPTNCRHSGLGFAVAESHSDNILLYWSVSDRIAVIQVRISKNSAFTLVSAPHSELTGNDVEVQDELFTARAHVTASNSSSALFHIAGNFNSKLGLREQDEMFMKKHSRGRTMNGAALEQFFSRSARLIITCPHKRTNPITGCEVVIYNTIV